MPLLALAFVTGVALAFAGASLATVPALAGLAAAAAGAWLAGGRLPAAFLAGFVAASVQGHRALKDDWPCTRDRETVEIAGRVVAPAESRPGRVDFDLAADRPARAAGVPALLRLTWYEPTATPRPGDSWRLAATLRCRSGYANPGGFERELDLLRRGYGATGYLSGPASARRLATQPWHAPVAAARAWVGERIGSAAGHSRSLGVMQGLAVGLRGGIEPALRDAFVETGTAHLIAISGLHVTAFAVVALLVFRRAYRSLGRPALSARWPALQALAVLACTVGYGLLAGASLPTVRTVVMVALVLALRVARRHAPMTEVLGASALLLAAADPAGVTSAGFWLSFAAVAALLGLVGTPAGPWRLLQRFMRAQAAVSLVLAPVLVAAFGGMPVVGPAVNAIAIPFFSVLLLPATLAGTALLPLAPRLADPLWSALGAALDRCWPLLQWAADLPGAVHRPPSAPGWLLAAALAATLAAVVVPGRGAKWLAGVVLASLLWRPAPAPPPAAFDLTVLDVGHGLAVVVRTAHRVLVFDTGPRFHGGGTAARVTLVPYLRWRGIGRIDTLVVSHADADHAGGLGELVADFEPAWVIGDGGEAGDVDEPCAAGRAWQWDGVSFTVVHPPHGATLGGNDSSCAIMVRAAGGAALLLADTEAPAEQVMLAQSIAADLVVVPHHGSDTSSTPGFVAAVGARQALVSSGFGNRWNLPRAAVVARWRQAGASVLTTAEGGALSVRIGPGAAPGAVEAWRSATPRWWRRH